MDQTTDFKGGMGANLAYQKGAAREVAHPHSAMSKGVGGTGGGIGIDSVRGNGTTPGEDDKLVSKKKAVFGSGHQILGRNSMD